MLPWFHNKTPLYLAPMAGITDTIFRQLCKEQGADVVITEFVSSEGIVRRNERTCEYLEFDDMERPLGIQLFGAEPDRMGEAARLAMEWVRPDFIDLNFGCPVNKVVSKNGGSALLRDCPLLSRVAAGVVKAVSPFPVTAKIRLGWDRNSINALETGRALQDAGIRALAVHGRTKEQGYSGEADWDTIARVADSLQIPVIGNGDIHSAADAARRLRETSVAGLMIGRGAMSSPWIFSEIKHFLATGAVIQPPHALEQWELIRRHCVRMVEKRGAEAPAMHAMRTRLMAYSRGMRDAKVLRARFQHVGSICELDDIREAHLQGEAEALTSLSSAA